MQRREKYTAGVGREFCGRQKHQQPRSACVERVCRVSLGSGGCIGKGVVNLGRSVLGEKRKCLPGASHALGMN